MAPIVCFLQSLLRQTDPPVFSSRLSFVGLLNTCLQLKSQDRTLHTDVTVSGISLRPNGGEAVEVVTATTLQVGRPKNRGLIRGRDKGFFSEKSRLTVGAHPASFSMNTEVKANGT